MPNRLLLFLVCSVLLFAQGSKFPLGSVAVNGSALSSETVTELAGLHLGQPISQADMESACKKLADTGLFASVGYRYAPGPKQSYALTLNLVDQPAQTPAVIDVPHVDEDEVWTWLATRFPAYSHRVPDVDSAQRTLAAIIEAHIASSLSGQHLITRDDSDVHNGLTVVFRPEFLPQISSMTFTGVGEFRSDQLADILRKAMGNTDFTPRRFNLFLNGAVRQAYEDHGMYRVQFDKIDIQDAGPQLVSVTTHVVEGPKFTLANVQCVGEGLPVDEMLRAAGFHRGSVAHWLEIQQQIYALERPLKRHGYFDAAAHPERQLHDADHTLDLRISFTLGPLYHFGQVTFPGLPPDVEAKARKMWNMPTGSVFDYAYADEFLRTFNQSTDLSKYRVKVDTRRVPGGEPIMDQAVIFVPASR